MPAPKKNQFALGNDGGRPKKWNSEEELQADIYAYFKAIDDNPIQISEVAGKDPVIMKVPTQRPYTIEGLATALGCDRKTLLNYQKAEGYEEFFHIIIRAKQKITEQWITLGLVGVFHGGLTNFLLHNNADYKNRSEIDHTTGGEKINTVLYLPENGRDK